MATLSPLARVEAALRGPYPALPRPLDAASERWAALQPRVRIVVTVIAVGAALAGIQARIEAADSRWGGAPVAALVATADLPVGAPLTDLQEVALPPGAVPVTAMTARPPEGAVLALALPEGAVLTESHVDARGPAAGLDEGLRALPIPVEDGWLVTPGGWVDVWVLAAGEEPARLVARSRPVLEVREDRPSPTALVGLDGETEIGPATAGLAVGRLLLAHAPAPTAVPAPGPAPRGTAPARLD